MQESVFSKIPGILLTTVIASCAWIAGGVFPIIGAAIFGILFGMVIGLFKMPDQYLSGIRFSSKKVLQAAIICLGFEMNFINIISVGQDSILIMIATISSALICAWLVGRQLKLESKTTILIGVGTAICGGSAIAAAAPVIKADDQEIAHSISTIFLFNVIAVFVFPFLGHLLGMGDYGFGMWAGTAINDTSSVVAAAYSYSPAAGELATIVKLTRSLMIIPITLMLSLFYVRKEKREGSFSFIKIFPWFIIGFLAAALINTSGVLPGGLAAHLGMLGKFMIVVAMAAIGINTDLKALIRNGGKSIYLGLACWICVAALSLAIQITTGMWK